MKCYLLLRDNKESGPYSLEELKALNLKSNDLIWAEGSSTSWNYPSEIAPLKALVPPKEQKHTSSVATSKNLATAKTKRVFVSLPYTTEPLHERGFANTEVHDEEPVLETRYCQSFDEMKALYAQRLEERKKSFRKKHVGMKSAVWITGLFLGMAFCAFLVKKMVDGLDTPLTRQDTPYVVAVKSEGDQSDNSISAANTSPEEEGNTPVSGNQTIFSTESPDHSISTVNDGKDAPQAIPKKNWRKATKFKNISKAVHIESNDYHVGLFGGVQDLQLTIMNTSDYVLDHVIIKVAFLKPNGQSIKEEELEATDIPAKGTRTLAVPTSNRGIKVTYKIIKVFSKDYDHLLET